VAGFATINIPPIGRIADAKARRAAFEFRRRRVETDRADGLAVCTTSIPISRATFSTVRIGCTRGKLRTISCPASPSRQAPGNRAACRL